MEDKKKVRLEELLPVITEKLANGGTVRLPVTGTSMLPLLVQGRDSVTLCAAKDMLKTDDLPLYRRREGAFVLHRVIAVNSNVYTMCGDNQWVPEPGVTQAQVIGVACAITRKGKTFSVESRRYRLYCRLWRRILPMRKYIVKIRGKLASEK